VVIPDLTNPDFWHAPDVHETVSELRTLGNVFHHDTASEGRIWSVIGYDAAVAVFGNHVAFSNEGGALLGSNGVTPFGVGRMMALTDPPKHGELRAPANPFFSARAVGQMQSYIQSIAADLVRQAIARGEVEFVRDVAAPLPAAVMCDLLGVPRKDRDAVVGMCDDAFLGDSARDRSFGHQQVLAYFFDLVSARRACPGHDLLSALAACRFQGAPLKDDDVVLNCDNILVGGVQTVRHTAALAMVALAHDSDAWETMRSAACNLDLAVEELLRWTSAGVNAVRTVARPCEIEGARVAPGERVVVWIPAVNRDPAVFPEPNRLDLHRTPNHHLTFGRGTHYCIGAPLARMELRALFEELRTRVRSLTILEPPVYTHSIIDLGLESLRMRLVAA
jgi:cytochrome P450